MQHYIVTTIIALATALTLSYFLSQPAASTSGRMALTPAEVAAQLLAPHNLTVQSVTVLQTLWAGYGHICALKATSATDSKTIPLILKLISPPKSAGQDEGHLRKMLSYEVEQYFYSRLAPQLPSEIAVAKCLASTKGDEPGLEGVVAMVMEDLKVEFPVAGGKRDVLAENQAYAALDWLASFHAESKKWYDAGELGGFVLPPLDEGKRRGAGKGGNKAWLNGGYTYLSTRRKEYASLQQDDESEWSSAFTDPVAELDGLSVAEAAAKVLTPRGRPMESYIHGDVKSENLFTTKSGDRVAFYDFQYVGLGLGTCDLAKLFTCSIPLHLLSSSDEERISMGGGERALLEQYRAKLLQGSSESRYPWGEFVRHWETALVDWCRFQASWGFWGNTDWLEGRVRSILADEGWRKWLKRELLECKQTVSIELT